MATLNSTIKAAHYPLSDIVRSYKSDTYIVDDRFQRRLVWTVKQKVRLIETILMGYPMPDIYLHQKEADEDGNQIFSIVDGQQRITTIVQFASGEWKIEKRYLDKENQQNEYVGKSWGDLPKEIKTAFWAYTVNSRVIPPEVSDDEIRKIFRRLNESDKSLNPQELRHAEFSGKVIQLAEAVADHQFWNNWSVFTPNNIRRMADVEIATSLIGYLRYGVVTDTPESINNLYDYYNNVYKEEKSDKSSIFNTLDFLDDIFKRSSVVADFYAKPIHIYTLFGVFQSGIKLHQKRKLTDALARFVSLYEGREKRSRLDSTLVNSYRNGSIQRTRSRSSRLLRQDALVKFLNLQGL